MKTRLIKFEYRDDRKESTAMTHKYNGAARTNENAYGSVTLNEI